MAAPGALLALALWALCAPRGGALAFHVQALGLLALAGVAAVRCSGLLRAVERLGAVSDGRTAVSVRALEALAARARLNGAAAMGLCALAAFLLARAP